MKQPTWSRTADAVVIRLQDGRRDEATDAWGVTDARAKGANARGKRHVVNDGYYSNSDQRSIAMCSQKSFTDIQTRAGL